MTSNTRDLDQLIAEQNEKYARAKRDFAELERKQQEELAEAEREIAEDMAEADREQERKRLADDRAFEWAERKDLLLRCIGYPTRAIAFLIMIGLWAAASYLWLAPEKIAERPLGSLTLKEIIHSLFWSLVCIGPLVMLVRGLFNDNKEGFIDWEAWDKFGLGLVGVAAAAGLWLSYGQREGSGDPRPQRRSSPATRWMASSTATK